ncbi:hypothetical protein Tco_1276651 [Tanacetum coccineum]
MFEVADSDMPHDQEGNPGDNDDEPLGLEMPLDENVKVVPYDYFIKNDPHVSTRRSFDLEKDTTSNTRQRPAQYDLQHWKTRLQIIWSSVKVAYDNMPLMERRCIFYKTYSGSHSMLMVLRKHGYGRTCRETWVRINDIEDMLILVVQNWLTNLSGDNVADFSIALRRSLVIQKRVEDLQLGVKSYQKKINVTKPDTTRPDLRKRHPYTPYKDPQGFIYVDDYKRNRLMRSDELYKFSEGS